MFGRHQSGRTYYACQPSLNVGQAATERHPDHPGSIYVREDALLGGLYRMLDERVFGPDRRALLAAELGHEGAQRRRDGQHQRVALERAITKISQRQERLVTSLETQDDTAGVIFDRVRSRMQQLEDDRTAKLAQLREIDQAQADTADPTVLDELPLTDLDWLQVPPDVQRELFDALQLTIRYDRATDTARGQITLVRGAASRVADAVAVQTAAGRATPRAVGLPAPRHSILVRAPGSVLVQDIGMGCLGTSE